MELDKYAWPFLLLFFPAIGLLTIIVVYVGPVIGFGMYAIAAIAGAMYLMKRRRRE